MAVAVPSRPGIGWIAVISVLAIAGAGLAPLESARANLLVNPDFDASLSGWSPGLSTNVAIQFDGRDVDGSPSSGSAFVENISGNTSQATGMSQLVAVVPGASYSVGGAILVPAGQTGGAFVGVTWRSAPGCLTGCFQGFFSSGRPGGTGSWVSVESSGVAPAGALAASIALTVLTEEEGADFAALFDSVFFVPEPSPTLLHGAALLALTGLLLAKRGSPRRLPSR